MKITYDQAGDVMYIQFQEREIARTKAVTPELVIDFDANDALVGIEVISPQAAGIDPLTVTLARPDKLSESAKPPTPEEVIVQRLARKQQRENQIAKIE
jgi:uncharacterized protein YuzE